MAEVPLGGAPERPHEITAHRQVVSAPERHVWTLRNRLLSFLFGTFAALVNLIGGEAIMPVSESFWRTCTELRHRENEVARSWVPVPRTSDRAGLRPAAQRRLRTSGHAPLISGLPPALARPQRSVGHRQPDQAEARRHGRRVWRAPVAWTAPACGRPGRSHRGVEAAGASGRGPRGGHRSVHDRRDGFPAVSDRTVVFEAYGDRDGGTPRT